MRGLNACMTIAAASVHPNYLDRQRIVAEDLRRLEEPCVIFEHEWADDDGEHCFAYTVGGLIDGRYIGDLRGGATVGGEVIIVHAQTRADADLMAGLGLEDTINALHGEETAYIEAHAAKARLDAAGPVRRIELATAKPSDTSDAFVRDTAAIVPLRGDDIVLTVGGVEQ